MSEPTCDCCGTDAHRTDERTDGTARSDGGAASADAASADVLERPIPAELGELAATAYGMDASPGTLGDWVEGLRAWARNRDAWPPAFDDLCHVEDSRHALELDGETHRFACVVDPLMAQGVLDREEMVVRSASPHEGAEIEIGIADGEAEVTPSTAVLSLGAARSVGRMDGEEFAPEEAYTRLCAYGNAFPNRTTYEAWADGTDAATMAIPLPEGVELARALAGEG